MVSKNRRGPADDRGTSCSAAVDWSAERKGQGNEQKFIFNDFIGVSYVFKFIIPKKDSFLAAFGVALSRYHDVKGQGYMNK